MKWTCLTRRIIASVGILVFWFTATVAQDGTALQNDEFDQAFEDQSAEFDQVSQSMNEEWLAWAQADSLAFQEFHNAVVGFWGDYRGTTKKDWVEYSDDLGTRTIVDFEAGTATVEVLVPETATTEEQNSRLAGAVENLVVDPGKTMDYPVLDQAPRPLGNRPVLSGQLQSPAGNPVTAETAKNYSSQLISTSTLKTSSVKSQDGISRLKISVTTPLVPGHLKIQAEKYLDTVRQNADRFGLDTRLVMALIHTESFFNPKARSGVPAFGLMQLVPSSGGRDAYEFLTGKASNPSVQELLDPDRNIELGCAYLSLIMERYLAGIHDSQSLLYCTICAYNTGAGNVSRAFTGTKKVKPAIEKINNMDPDQVLSVLKQDLPFEETKHYIANVLERVKFYQEWKN